MNDSASITVHLDVQPKWAAWSRESAQAEHERNLAHQKQKAKDDHSAYDVTDWELMAAGPLMAAGEAELDQWLNRATQAMFDMTAAATLDKGDNESLSANLIVNAPGLPRDTKTALGSQKTDLDRINNEIDKQEKKREDLVDILNGNPDSEQRSWNGEPPPKPSPGTTVRDIRWSSANVQGKLRSIGSYAVLGLCDGGIVVNNLRDHLRTDNWFFAGALSVVFLFLLVAFPGFIGRTLSKIQRRPQSPPGDFVRLFGSIVAWIFGVVGSTYLRVDADSMAAKTKAAIDLKIPVDEVNLSDVYNLGMNICVWTFAVAGAGLFVIALELFAYNPIINQVLKVDRELVKLYAKRATGEVIVEKAEALIKDFPRSAGLALEVLEHFRDKDLPAQANECAQRYRSCLAREYNNPELTLLIMGRDIVIDGKSSHRYYRDSAADANL